MKHIAILGLGVSGKALLRYFLRQGIKPLLFDKNVLALKNESDLKQLTVHPEERELLEGVEQLVISPGVDPHHPLIQEAEKRGINFTSEMEIAAERLAKEPVKLFAITGSCGKTTTTSLVTHVLCSAGLRAKSFGNIGYPLIQYFLDDEKIDYLVVEVSSAQLDALKERELFDCAVILNIFPNHLDYHRSMDRYVLAKMKMQSLLKKGASLYISKKIKEEFGSYLDARSTICIFDEEKVASICTLSYRNGNFKEFVGDIEDSLAAYKICAAAQISIVQFVDYAKNFQKDKHRLEFVRTLKEVTYVNDSKATTVAAVIAAVNAMKGEVVLIAGGIDKGMDFTPWIEAFKKSQVARILLMGKASDSLASLLAPHLPVEKVGTLEKAVARAKIIAKPNSYVLLSPGCASFDQFLDYQQRGERFKELVLELEGSP